MRIAGAPRSLSDFSIRADKIDEPISLFRGIASMRRFVQIDRETDYLLPPSVDEWLPTNHLAQFVVEVIDPLDLSRLTGAYAGRGSAAAPGLLVHGHATGCSPNLKRMNVPRFA